MSLFFAAEMLLMPRLFIFRLRIDAVITPPRCRFLLLSTLIALFLSPAMLLRYFDIYRRAEPLADAEFIYAAIAAYISQFFATLPAATMRLSSLY